MVVTRSDAIAWVMYCHGNSVSLSDLYSSGIPQQIVEHCQCNFVAPQYPVQTHNGQQHDDEVCTAVQNTYEKLCQDTSSPVYVVGRSIGAGVALQSCVQNPPAGLVLISGFSSLKEMAPWGLQWAMPSRFDNSNIVARLKGVPKLIIHGDSDMVVPVQNAHVLEKSCDKECCKYVIKGMTHVPSQRNITQICDYMRKLIHTGNNAVTPHHYSLWKTQ